ncbi:MAG TPA: acyl-CoA dehydrogenase [Actinomycetales bacterium]|nr:acyl-CoA dehydrogenase [Actinomycetales bacterium]
MTQALGPDGGLAAALRRTLDGRWSAVRDDVRALPAELVVPRLELTDVEAQRALVAERLQALAARGHGRRGLPPAHGGDGDVGGGVVAFEMLGYGDLSLLVRSGVQWGLFGGAVLSLGTERHHELLDDIASLRLPGCFAMTETDHGSDVQSLRTTATYDESTDELVVHTPYDGATKNYIGGAARDARLAVVFCQLSTRGKPRGVHAVLVPVRDQQGHPCPGVTVADCGVKAGLNGVDNGRLAFDHVRVPRTNLLGRYGDIAPDGTYSSPVDDPDRRFFTMLGTLVRGRVSVAGAAGAATRLALTIAVRYGEARRQFSRPGGAAGADEVVLLDYRAHQRRLLPALATSYALAFAQDELVGVLHDLSTRPGDARDGSSADGDVRADDVAGRQHAQRELESRAAGLKAVATWHATATIQTCREACGGAGYMSENRLPALKADTDVFTTFEGDNTVLLQLVAKGLLTAYREEFGSLDTRGTVRFVVSQVAGTVIERTTALQLIGRLVESARSRDGEGDVLDRGHQLSLLEQREEHVLDGLARRLRRGAADGVDPFELVNDAQDHLLLAARAHVDRVVLEAFVAGIDRCDDDAREVLERLADLHVLSLLERERGWFLEHGRMSTRTARSLPGHLDQLCAALRPHASALVDAFGIPEEWLGATIV